MVVGSGIGAGCYRYAPLDPQSPQTALGEDVRARLTDAGAVTLAPLIGNRVELVDGRVVAVADTAVTLAVTATTDRRGVETPWRGEHVTLPRMTLSGLEQRKLDRGRSYLVGGIAAGLVAAVGVGFNLAGNGGGGNPGSNSGSAK